MREPIYKFIDIKDIKANGKMPRNHFEKEKIQELAVSIRQNGLLQPIVVRLINEKYHIVIGERRYHACILAGLEEIPCIVQDYNEQRKIFVENDYRSPIHEALAYQQLLDAQDLTKEELAHQLGKPLSLIQEKLQLLQLPITIQEAIKKSQITQAHAQVLLGLKSTALQNSILKEIIKHHLTVQQTQAYIDKIIGQPQDIHKTINILEKALQTMKQENPDIQVDIKDTKEDIIYTIKLKK